ncbi:DNA cytosine methyltransferase [Deinococcus misasensis]|uniref:DNA cytosine methyltransferase n=1 Tax=Deinococcus misasensis TaxID=392413 RepID=UPI000A0048E8|nr:DNA cytosine methyltransferase [Deinococcus misasensis]
MTAEKPPYQIPSMAEITQLPWNGYNVVSTFSGAGGNSTGYRMAGFRVLWANEFVEAARDTYQANHPTTILDARDIRTVTAADIMQATGLNAGELDLFDGSPPCAAFSTAGKREKAWGQVKEYSDTSQVVDDLFFEYTRLLKDLQPKTFIAENVSGLVKGTAKGYFKLILQALKACGYRVKAPLLNAAWLGAPTARERLIFIGVREDLELEPPIPTPLPYQYTLREAFGGADEIPGEFKSFSRNTQTYRLWSWLKNRNQREFEKAAQAVLGRSTMMQHYRCTYDRPVNTVVQGSQSLYHPLHPRTLTIPELKRVSSFPDDYVLTGSFARQWERIGRAVPPLFMRAIADTLRKEVLDKCKT